MGGATLAYGLHMLRRVTFLALSAVVFVVLASFVAGMVLARLLGMF